MKSRVIEQIASAGKESIIKWWDHDSGSIFINSLLRRAIMDYAEKLNKFAYERWMHSDGKAGHDINKFFEIDENFAELRGYERLSDWQHVAIETFEQNKSRYKCITGEVYRDNDGNHIIVGVDLVDGHPYTCDVHKQNVHYFPEQVEQFKIYEGDRETYAIARMINNVLPEQF